MLRPVLGGIDVVRGAAGAESVPAFARGERLAFVEGDGGGGGGGNNSGPPPAVTSLRRIWVFDELGEDPGGAAGPGDDKLRRLANQVLAFARWHRGAVIEYGAADGSGTRWEVIDSPLLNRGLDLSALTDSRDPTARPRFALTQPGLAPASFEGQLRVGGRDVTLTLDAPKALAGDGEAPRLALRGRWGVGVGGGVGDNVTSGAAGGAGAVAHVLSLTRSVPFQLDGDQDTFYRWPAWQWLPISTHAATPATARAVTPAVFDLALHTPRPGELLALCRATTAAGRTADGAAPTYAPGPQRSALSRTPNGRGVEDVTFTGAPDLPAPAHRFRDHLRRVRLAWTRQHQIKHVADADAPVAVALHSPEVVKQALADEPVWLRIEVNHAALEAKLGGTSPWRLFAVLAAPDALPPAVQPRVRVFAAGGDTPRVEREARRVPLLIASSAVSDNPPGPDAAAIRSGQDLQIRVSGRPGEAVAGPWKLALVVKTYEGLTPATLPALEDDVDGPDRAGDLANPADAASLTFDVLAPGERRNVAGDLPALLAIVRGEAAARRLVAFGPESQAGWRPIALGSGEATEAKIVGVGWAKCGEFVDAVPADPDPEPGQAAEKQVYRLIVLRGDGAVTAAKDTATV